MGAIIVAGGPVHRQIHHQKVTLLDKAWQGISRSGQKYQFFLVWDILSVFCGKFYTNSAAGVFDRQLDPHNTKTLCHLPRVLRPSLSGHKGSRTGH